MKTRKIFFSGLAGIFAMAFCPSDECGIYAPVKEGTELEIKNFSASGKAEGSNRLKVISSSNTPTGQRVEMKSEAFDKKDKPVGTSNYVLNCENGEFFIDMRTMIPQNQTEAYKDMQVNVEADRLDIPSNPSPGQQLRNGSVKMTASSEGSPITMKLAMTVTNRKVA